MTKSPPQETASTHLSMVASHIRKPANPAHVLVIGCEELIDRPPKRSLRGELQDLLPIMQELDESAHGRLAVPAMLRRRFGTTTPRQVAPKELINVS
jgi:hypothetical protein